MPHSPWDYLIVTASSEMQAATYRTQINVRNQLGLLDRMGQVLVVTDPGSRGVGSGGSTICCLIEVLRRELARRGKVHTCSNGCAEILQGLRVLIVHGGGDARRLPAYEPCGRLFVPAPGHSDSAVGPTLFDRQLPTYLDLPTSGATGQVVITAGDVLLRFEPAEVCWQAEGATGLGCFASPQTASQHGVFCLGESDLVRRYLQKPSPQVQAGENAVDIYGQTLLDVGVFGMDMAAAACLLNTCGVRIDAGKLSWSGPIAREIEQRGLDFYREIACAFGTETTLDKYIAAARSGGSRWPDSSLRQLHNSLNPISCRVHVVKQCQFLHFGAATEILASGRQMARSESGFSSTATPPLLMNSRIDDPKLVVGGPCWIEGSSVAAPLALRGENLVVGADVDEPLELPDGACLDLAPGTSRGGQPVVFVRCYQLADCANDGAKLCGQSLDWWAVQAGTGSAAACELWPDSLSATERMLWNARVFPAETGADGFRRWLWCFAPQSATADQWRAWRMADRYSFAEMAELADRDAFHQRRQRFNLETLLRSLSRLFRHDSGFSADDLAYVMKVSTSPERWIAGAIREARRREETPAESVAEAFGYARVLHTLGSALSRCDEESIRDGQWLRHAWDSLEPETQQWLDCRGLGLAGPADLAPWIDRSQSLAIEHVRCKIVGSGRQDVPVLRSALRSDEIAWGRAPARLDLAGGWSDTPPYSLENGGAVLNAAVLLNGEPPVQVYVRMTAEPAIRVRSIDLGTRYDILDWDELGDYSSAVGPFSLVKGALAICGFTPRSATAVGKRTLRELLIGFGGGLEITTLAAIPKGSGLGTSSIMGAVLLAVINRTKGRHLSQDELFHDVLRLEQELTTGGGWQDQIGGAVSGLKLAACKAGMLPEATIRYLPPDVLDPRSNGGQTLLYYTGITRLAKNILQNVVGRYLNRDRAALAALRELAPLAAEMADAVGRKDFACFGRLIDDSWTLNRRLEPNSTTPEIEELLARVRPLVHGAKLLGAGGGGFLFLVAKSPADAAKLRETLEEAPPNSRARFFDFQVSDVGLAVSVC